MKEIKLTRGKVSLVDDEYFEFLNQWKWMATKAKNSYYARRIEYVNGKQVNIQMARVILGLTDKLILADHIDGNGLNNQTNNLRPATRSQNCRNKKSKVNSKSKYLGVSWNESSKKWQVMICSEGKNIYIGLFKEENAAAIAYNEKAITLHGSFANLNLL